MSDEKETAELKAMREDRDMLAALLARMCLAGAGWPAGVATYGDTAKRVLFVETPEGQLSWEFSERLGDLFDDLPEHQKPWDGHNEQKKHDRIRRVIAQIDGFNKHLLRKAEEEAAGASDTTIKTETPQS